MWNVETKVILIITGANGTISKSFRKIPEQHTENSHIGHCVHASGSTDVKYKTFNMGKNM